MSSVLFSICFNAITELVTIGSHLKNYSRSNSLQSVYPLELDGDLMIAILRLCLRYSSQIFYKDFLFRSLELSGHLIPQIIGFFCLKDLEYKQELGEPWL